MVKMAERSASWLRGGPIVLLPGMVIVALSVILTALLPVPNLAWLTCGLVAGFSLSGST